VEKEVREQKSYLWNKKTWKEETNFENCFERKTNSFEEFTFVFNVEKTFIKSKK